MVSHSVALCHINEGHAACERRDAYLNRCDNGRGAGWLVLVQWTLVPQLSAFQSPRTLFSDLAATFGGEYDGWEAEVVN